MVRTSIEREAIAEVTVYGARVTFPCSSLPWLPHPQRGIERVEQGRLAERLEQALDGALRARRRGRTVASPLAGDEDNRNLLRRRISSC